jgi:hypothetical protein
MLMIDCEIEQLTNRKDTDETEELPPFIFPPILLCWHGADFHSVLPAFFAFFLRERSNAKILKLVDLFISPGQTERAAMSVPSRKRKAPPNSTGASVCLMRLAILHLFWRCYL